MTKVAILPIATTQGPDQFFSASQQQRLDELMTRWRAAQERGEALAEPEQAELTLLIEAELTAAGQRAAALASELGR